jgi:hypothetical protein
LPAAFGITDCCLIRVCGAAGKVKQLGDYQKFVIGEMIGLMVAGGDEPGGQSGSRLGDDA